MANNALKTLLKTDLIEIIRGNLSNSNNYYLFVSRPTPYEDVASTTTIVESDNIPPSIGESSRNVYDTYRNMVFLKRLRPENMRLVIPRIDWTAGEVYTAYSETTDMAGENYYVLTTDFNVYKCMGAAGASEIMPTGKSTDVITLSDGYKWKYIYSVPENDIEFMTLEYIPVFTAFEDYAEQQEVQNTALPGSIDTVSVNPGTSPIFDKVFKNTRFMSNSFAKKINDDLGIQVNMAGSSYISFSPIGENNNPVNDYYNNYGVYVSGGKGVGQYFRILDFVKAGTGVSYCYANVYPTIDRDLDDTSAFKIVPYVVVDGDGENAVVVPTTSSEKRISGLSIINPGRKYTSAKPRVVTESGSVTIGSQVSQFNDSVSVSLSTPAGHGANAIKEFGTSDLMVVVEIDGTEGGKISTRNDYRQFGIVKNPYLHGGITLAGQEEEISLKALIKKQPNKEDYQYGYATFVPGNYIYGKETRATAKILDSDRIPGSRFHRLYLTDIVGDFRFSEDSSNKIRLHFSPSFAGTFSTGDTANQYLGTYGLTLNASGTIVSVDNPERNIVIDTTFGSFVSGKTMYFLGVSGSYTLNKNLITDIDQEFGELLGQVHYGTTLGSEFLKFGGDEVFGRLASTALVPTLIEDLGEYRTTTKLEIVSSGSPYTDGILTGAEARDGYVTQTDSTTLKKVTGDVVDFVVPKGQGFTGYIYLSNVRGIFNTADTLFYSVYGSTAQTQIPNTGINSLQNSEIAIGSGELLYIENVRPVERNIEQTEQFKIVIGF